MTRSDEKREAALEALLTLPTVAAAARATGLSERTLFRRLAEPAFRAEYQAASKRRLDEAVGKLRGLSAEAIEALRGALRDESGSVRVRAAGMILSHALGCDLDEIRARVEALEHRAPEAKES